VLAVLPLSARENRACEPSGKGFSSGFHTDIFVSRVRRNGLSLKTSAKIGNSGTALKRLTKTLSCQITRHQRVITISLKSPQRRVLFLSRLLSLWRDYEQTNSGLRADCFDMRGILHASVIFHHVGVELPGAIVSRTPNRLWTRLRDQPAC